MPLDAGNAHAPSVFDGVPPETLAEIADRLEVRRFPAGTVVIAEGEHPREMYVIRSGTLEIFVADRQGVEHRVTRLEPGTTVGEMSLFTGQPAAGTARAAEALELLVLDQSELERLGAAFPQIYRNLGAILSRRLARTTRLVLREEPGRLAVLDDRGGPPLLGYALACSVAWHTRRSTLLLALDDEPPEPLARLSSGGAAPPRSPGDAATPAHVLVVPPDGRYAPTALAGTLEELCTRYEHVLVQARGGLRGEVAPHRTLTLAGEPAGGPAGGMYMLQGWSTGGPRLGPDPDGVLRVPALVAADEQELSRGRLPATTAAGRTLGWAARDVAGLKVGIALGAGSVRGFAHFGALRALERAGISPDCIAGTSIGAAAAALYAVGNTPTEAAEIFQRWASALFRPTVSTKGFLSNRALRRVLQRLAGDRRIEDLGLPLALVAADIDTNRPVVFTRGLVWQAVLASISIPGIYPAQRIGQYTVVDGGVLDPLPCGVVSELGADVVIGVRLGTRPLGADMDIEAAAASGRPPSAISVILRSFEMMQARLAPETGDATTIIVSPELPELPSGRLRSFRHGMRYVEDGEAAAEAAMHRIAAALPWLRA